MKIKNGGGTFLSVYFLSSDNKVGVVAGVFKGAQFLATGPVYNVAITASSRKKPLLLFVGRKRKLIVSDRSTRNDVVQSGL